MRRYFINLLIVFLFVFTTVSIPSSTVKASSSITASDLINLVNGIRTGYGLPALVENNILDQEAQWTAEEMASIGANTHLVYLGYSDASTRAANYGFGAGKIVFVTENWYAGYTATLSDIQSGWADTAHMLPMTKAEYVYVGAGVATSASGNVYYVLQAGYISGEAAPVVTSNTSATTVNTSSNISSEWLAPVSTSTPSADGMVYHVVQTNQTLFYIALAYDVTVDSIVELNGLSSANAIYSGQTLKIKYAPTPTPTSTFTPTAVYPTRTPSLTPIAGTPAPVLTATPTALPPLSERLPKFDRGTLGLLLVILSGLGLLVVVYVNFVKPGKKK